MHRRNFITGSIATLCLSRASLSLAAGTTAPALQVAATSPWLTNGVATTRSGEMFINFPRFKGHERSPALAKMTPRGPQPFPGNAWNSWKPGDSGVNALVNVNAVHIFNDNNVWAVDQGAAQGEKPAEGAAKLVAFDSKTGKVTHLIRFDNDILPEGGAPNDLRIFKQLIYVTDSGLGGILIHDLTRSRTRRKLSKSAFLRKPEGVRQKGYKGTILQDGSGKYPAVHSDMLEVSPDGQWLYFSAPTGPLYKIKTAYLNDDSLDDTALESHIQKVAEVPSIGGTAIDSQGTLYLSNVENRSIDRLSADGTLETIIKDEKLITPDALFIDRQGWIFIPAPQIEYLSAHAGGTDKTRAPWYIYRFRLV